MMYTSWSTPCVHFSPAFAALSLKYGRDANKLRFGHLDLGRWPGMAPRYGVDLNATASQLPTLLCFKDGKEADRLPRKGLDGRGAAKGRWGAADVERAFNLAGLAGGDAPATPAAKTAGSKKHK